MYGTLDNNHFLTQMYANILHRAPDPGGLAFWLNVLDTKADTRSNILAQFSESAENVGYVAEIIGNGFNFAPFD